MPCAKPRAQGSQNCIFGRIYDSFPLVPFLDRPTSAIVYASLSIYFAFTAFVFLSAPPLQFQVDFTEGPLQKNTQLPFLPGETYEFSVSSPESSARASYRTHSAPSCPGIVLESVRSKEKVCLLKNGLEHGLPEGGQSNAGLGNGTFILFSPWMLAASEGFEWQTSQKITVLAAQSEIFTTYRCAGKRKIAGRDAFEIVSITGVDSPGSFSGNGAQRMFIDEERRVLLLAEIGNMSAKLISAPFALNWSGED